MRDATAGGRHTCINFLFFDATDDSEFVEAVETPGFPDFVEIEDSSDLFEKADPDPGVRGFLPSCEPRGFERLEAAVFLDVPDCCDECDRPRVLGDRRDCDRRCLLWRSR